MEYANKNKNQTGHISPFWHGIDPAGQQLRPQQVASKLGLSRSQIYQMIDDGELPPFLKLSTRASAMPESWLDAFVLERVKRSDANRGLLMRTAPQKTA